MKSAILRTLFVWVLLSVYCMPADSIVPHGLSSIEFQGKRWVASGSTELAIREYRDRTALRVGGGANSVVYLPDVEIGNGTVEVDLAIQPRGLAGINFRSCPAEEEYCRVMLRRQYSQLPAGNGVIEQAVFTRRNGALCFLEVGVPKTAGTASTDIHEWFHVKVVFLGGDVKVYLDGSERPSLEMGAVFAPVGRGTVGVCGTDFHFADFRYTPAD